MPLISVIVLVFNPIPSAHPVLSLKRDKSSGRKRVKKGESSSCNNYCGIALMSVYAKLYNRILFVRLRDTLEKHLRPNQNGFRSTAQQVLALRRLMEKMSSTQAGKLVAVFIDFSKAFDSVDWNYIENILLACDVPKALVEAVLSLYYGAQASVKVGSSLLEPFDLGAGVLQGDTLAPYLFVIVLDWAFRHAIPDESLGVEMSPQSRTRSRTITPVSTAPTSTMQMTSPSYQELLRTLRVCCYLLKYGPLKSVSRTTIARPSICSLVTGRLR